MKMSLIVIGLVLVLVSGCFPHLHSGSSGSNLNIPSDAAEAFQNTVMKVDYLLSIFMLAVVAGVIVGLVGFKIGWMVAVGNLLGIFLHLTVARYGQWLALMGLLSALAAVVAMVLYIRKFKFQNVKAIQIIRNAFPDLKQEITSILQHEQDPLVQNDILKIKTVLKNQDRKVQMKKLKLF